MRKCFACGSNKTRMRFGTNPEWCLNRPTDLVLCVKCNKSIIRKEQRLAYDKKRYWKDPERYRKKSLKYWRDHPDKYLENSKKHIQFIDKTIHTKINPRTGFCSKCGKKDSYSTHIHHAEGYSEKDPLKGTVELCVKCHGQAHKEMRLLKGRSFRAFSVRLP